MSYLTDHELLMVAYAAEASGPKDDETMERIIGWAHKVRGEGALLDLVVQGAVVLDWDRVGRCVSFRLMEAAYRGRVDN